MELKHQMENIIEYRKQMSNLRNEDKTSYSDKNIIFDRRRKKLDTAIYWDYQNVQLRSSTSSTILVDKILDFAREKGELGTLRAYG